MTAILLAIALMFVGQAQDDGFGACPAFSHKHPTVAEAMRNSGYADLIQDGKIGSIVLDGLCHRDDTDAPITPRKVLPKFHPDPKSRWL